MTLPDPTAGAALSGEVIKPAYFAFLDFVGDPVRANSTGANLTPSGTGDADLDGFEFLGISHQFVTISSIRVAQGGSNSVIASLSGLPVLDGDTLTLIGDPANWQGRVARLWRIIRDEANTQQGGFQPYYTGYMTALDISGLGAGQTIDVTIETYLAAFSQASGRTYLDQERYDAGDLSAKAAIAIANGVSGVVGNTPGTPGNGGGGGGIERGGPGVRLL